MSIAINFTRSDSGPPIWVKILGSGVLDTRDSKGPFVVSNPASIITRTREMMLGDSLPVDIEHSIDLKAPLGLGSPSAGWITDFRIDGGEIFGKISWTSLGKSALSRANGKPAYNFLSPVIEYDEQTGEVKSILRASLTHWPNLANMAIAQNSNSSSHRSIKEKTMTITEKIAALRAEQAVNSTRDGESKKMNETQRKIAHLMGVSDEQYLAAAGRRAAIVSTHAKDHEVREGRRAALDVFPNAMRKIAAADSGESIDSEELIARAKNHLDARDDEAGDHMDGDDRLVAAAKDLLQAIEQRDNPNSSHAAAHAGFVMTRLPGVRFVTG